MSLGFYENEPLQALRALRKRGEKFKIMNSPRFLCIL
jgi:hypothetical protein